MSRPRTNTSVHLPDDYKLEVYVVDVTDDREPNEVTLSVEFANVTFFGTPAQLIAMLNEAYWVVAQKSAQRNKAV